MSVSAWDGGHWDVNEWNAGPPPEPGWGDDWAWWFQPGVAGPSLALNEMVVEARWTTDAHTLGDGSFRGDLQPGTLTLRLWDPHHALDNLDKFGAIWAWYRPTNTVWAWFYDNFTRGLFAPGDPAAADCVYSGVTWPSRLTSLRNETGFPSQSVSARLAAIVAGLGGGSGQLYLPRVSGNTAGQSQQMLAAAGDTSTGVLLYPGYLAALRDASTDGVGWLAYTTAGPTGPGALVVSYARWEAATTRILDRSQIVAGPAVTASIGFLITLLVWAATNGANGAASTFHLYGANVSTVGVQGPGSLRLWGDVSATSAPEWAGANATGVQLVKDRSDATEQVLSSVSLQSGTRWTAAGLASTADWDPYAHVFSPTDVARVDDGAGNVKSYRVVKSDHRLTSTVWQTTHYLEKHTAATPLP